MNNDTDAEELKNRPVQGSHPTGRDWTGRDWNRHGAVSGEDKRPRLCQAQVSRQGDVLV